MNPLWPNWLKIAYVVFCVVGMIIVMTALGWLISPYVPTMVSWIDGRLGWIGWLGLAVFAIAGVVINVRSQRS